VRSIPSIVTCLALCVALGPADAAVFEAAPCAFALPAGRTEGTSVRCGSLVVPENREQPDGRAVRLAVAIFKNPAGTTAADPIVYLSGGPGGSALEYLSRSFDLLFGGLTASGRDVVVFDQRGVGVSVPALDCPLDTSTTPQWLACADSLRTRADLTQYHTAANASDVEDLRRVLGYERINLWGTSYGTRLALDVMRDHPRGLRSVVLDSVYPADVDLYVEAPANAQRAIDQLFASCAADPTCAQSYPDLARTLVSAMAQLDAQPARLHTVVPFTGQGIDLTLTGTDLAAVLFRFLYVSDLVPFLPRMIHDAAFGRYTIIERYLGAFIADADAVSTGMQISVMCHDEAAFSSKAAQEASAAAFPLAGPVFREGPIGAQAFDICAGWGAGRAAEVENAPVSSDVPTLLLAGELDPITPPEWAHRAARTLPGGRAYTFTALGHGIGHEPCGRAMMLAFLKDPAAPPDASCASARRIAWVTGGVSAASLSVRPADVAALVARHAPAWRSRRR
jgi:pimeloyl-ACP methyl ester carboxylesterase